MQRQLIRARQIRALYQRELTALHRNQVVGEAERTEHIRRLWRQAVAELTQLQQAIEVSDESLTPEQHALLKPPKRPAELDEI